MNRGELLNEIMKTKEHLADMEKMLGECSWKPEEGEKFFFIDAWNRVCDKKYREINVCCREYYSTYNCFKTQEEAKQEAEKILIRRQLEDIAKRLNKTEKIDWNDNNQPKYFFYFAFSSDEIVNFYHLRNKEQGVVCCLDKNFLNVAVEEIGEERLKKYLRGE